MAVHIVVLPYPAQGHFSPAIQLARKIAAHGVLVTIVNVESMHKEFSKTWNCPQELGIHLEQVPFDVDIPYGFDVFSQKDRVQFQHHINNMRKPFELLLERLDPPASCIVADEFLFWPSKLAKELGLPCASYFPGCATWTLVHYHLDLVISNGDLPLGDSSGDQLVTYVPGLPPTRAIDLPEYFHKAEKEAIETYHRTYLCSADATWVLVNSFYELEPKAFDVMRQAIGEKYVPIGPLFPLAFEDGQVCTSLRNEDYQCLDWLDNKPQSSVLYVSFGSCSRLSKSDFEELAYGLKASNHFFVWVLPEMFAEGKTDEVYHMLAESCAGQGLFVPWAPQLKVLAHSSTGGFLTHCGWNSTLESICNGVPMLGWPQHSDQDLNGSLIIHWKVGYSLVPRGAAADRNSIEKQVREFMDVEKTFQLRAQLQKLKDAAKLSASMCGSSSSNIDAFVNEIKRHKD